MALRSTVNKFPIVPNSLERRATSKTIIANQQLREELALVRAQGYATADEEHYLGLRALAAPIFDHANSVRAAVSLNGSIQERAWSDLAALVQLVEVAAHEISKASRIG